MKSFLGLDIGTANIKLVEMVREGKGVKVINAGLSPTPERAFLSEAEADQEELGRTIKKLFQDSGIKNREAYLSILESQVFTRVIETPKLSEKELAQSLKWEAEQYIPLPLDEVNMDFVVLERKEEKEKMKVLLVAAPLRLIEKYSKIASLAGLEIKALESESVAFSRLLGSLGENLLILDFGAFFSSIYLLNGKVLLLVRVTNYGSHLLTKALISELNLPLTQAEEYKRTYGLETSQMEGKVVAVLEPLVASLLSELQQSLIFFKEKYPEEVINRLLLTGGGSLLPGLSSYLQEKLGFEVFLGNPWGNFLLEEKVSSQFSGQEILFSVATGMAVRDLKG